MTLARCTILALLVLGQLLAPTGASTGGKIICTLHWPLLFSSPKIVQQSLPRRYLNSRTSEQGAALSAGILKSFELDYVCEPVV